MEGWQEGGGWWGAGPRMLSLGLGTSPGPPRRLGSMRGELPPARAELGPTARPRTATGQRGPGNGATPRGGRTALAPGDHRADADSPVRGSEGATGPHPASRPSSGDRPVPVSWWAGGGSALKVAVKGQR